MGHHEMTPIPMALVSEKDQLMYDGGKATFVKKSLKDTVTPINTSTQTIATFVVDGGWLWMMGMFNWSNIKANMPIM